MRTTGKVRRAAFIILIGTGTAATAGRPLTVDDANVNEAGRGQLEAWVAHATGATVYNLAPAYAPMDGLEIGALLSRERGASLSASALQAKWRITASREHGCNVAAVAGLARATAAANAAYLNGLLTCNQPDWGSAHLNLGVSKARRSQGTLVWGIAYERPFLGVTPHIEWFGAERAKPTLQVGLRANFTTQLQLDGTVGSSSGIRVYTVGAKLTF